MDELSAFKFAPPELIELEVGLLNNADVVFTGGQSIFNAKKNRHSNIHCCPSSIDKAHFGAARSSNLAEPVDQAAIKGTKIGWFGVIDERFDIALLGAVAQAKPEWQFIMLGPVVKIDPATLPQADNIHWLGGKHYQELPAYLAHWQAGFMPFALNESTKFISPTKTPEYLAAGVPVVSTAIQDVIHPYRDLELVSIVGDPREAVLALESAIILPKEIWLSRVDNFLADKSWDATWNFMNQEIENVLTGVNRGGL
jgi:glycosyltransferase involved in cell wall biosynthesis